MSSRSNIWSYGGKCGLFALANATLLCNGSDPCTILHAQSANVSAFLRCIEQQYLAPFPLRGKKRKVKHPKIQLIDLFCICRLPETAGDQMVQCCLCKNWFHTKCVNVPQICLQQSKQELSTLINYNILI